MAFFGGVEEKDEIGLDRLKDWQFGGYYMGFYVFLGKANGPGRKRWDGMGTEEMGKEKERESVCDCERRLISVCVEMLEKIRGE